MTTTSTSLRSARSSRRRATGGTSRSRSPLGGVGRRSGGCGEADRDRLRRVGWGPGSDQLRQVPPSTVASPLRIAPEYRRSSLCDCWMPRGSCGSCRLPGPAAGGDPSTPAPPCTAMRHRTREPCYTSDAGSADSACSAPVDTCWSSSMPMTRAGGSWPRSSSAAAFWTMRSCGTGQCAAGQIGDNASV
jgi:hypothetical protein